MNPDALKPLTVSKETEILMNLMEELRLAFARLLPLLDLLNTPQGEEEQEMIRRLLKMMMDVETELARSSAWREEFEARQAKIEENQILILQNLNGLTSKITDMHAGFMPLIAEPEPMGG